VIEAKNANLFGGPALNAAKARAPSAQRACRYLIKAVVDLAVFLTGVIVVFVLRVAQHRHRRQTVVIGLVRGVAAAHPETDFKGTSADLLFPAEQFGADDQDQ